MNRSRQAGFIKKRLAEARLPEWMSATLGSADDPMGMLAVGTIVVAVGWMSFRFWRRRQRRVGAAGKAKP